MSGEGEGDMSVAVPSELAPGIVLRKWRVRQGAPVTQGRPLLEYSEGGAAPGAPVKTIRAERAGVVKKFCRLPGDALLPPGCALLELESCRHPTVMKDMCADCGEDLRVDDEPRHNASVPMIHAVPELKVSEELAKKLGREDGERLLKDRKLALLVDLDQTIIHTTNDDIPPNIKDVEHFRLRGWAGGECGRWYHMRLRPGTRAFLKSASADYELHICTFGARAYAHRVAQILDPDGKLFSHRILSRDECFDIHTKTPNLKALFPCGDDMVCIIDDREDVWNRAPNLIQVKPYHFFEHTGDINAPPGLEKMERDAEGQGLHVEDIAVAKEKTEKSDTAVDSNASSEMPSLDADSSQNAIDSEKNDLVTNEVVESVKEDPIVQNSKPEGEDSENKSPEKANDVANQTEEKTSNPPNATPATTEKEGEEAKDSFATDESTNPTSLADKGHPKWKENEDGKIEIEDKDDYLLYLEDILKRIHKYFYELYDSMEVGSVPDLKNVIPQVKSRVLAGTSLVFSGLVPNFQKLEHSRAYMVARSLGAEVTQDFTPNTTHLVAAKGGTAKVHMCRRIAGDKPHIVTPAWLWSCAERWQHVDERVFPLRGGGGKPTRKPPAHCASPPHTPPHSDVIIPPLRKRTPSGRFMDNLNPLLSFSSDDIADMDREVEDMINGSDESDNETKDPFDEDEDTNTDVVKNDLADISDSSDSSGESLSADTPEGFKSKRKRKHSNSNSVDKDEDATPTKQSKDKISLQDTDSNDFFREESTCEEFPSPKHKKGNAPDPNESDSSVDNTDMDDGEWNMMGAALEREFLGLDKNEE